LERKEQAEGKGKEKESLQDTARTK